MGWVYSSHPDHEGYVVALVARDGCLPKTKLYRELNYPGDDASRDDVVAVQAGCVCGWRSSYLPFLHEPARWYPFDVVVDEADEARCERLHHEHSLEAPR
jgi:hypothetical protein